MNGSNAYPHGHPPAADYGPVIHLPKGYLKRYDDDPEPECFACVVADDGICPGHAEDLREDGAVEAARARWEEGD